MPISPVSFHWAFQKLLSLCFRWQVHDQMNTESVDVSAWRSLIRRLTGSVNTLKYTFSVPSSATGFMWNVCISPSKRKTEKTRQRKSGIFISSWMQEPGGDPWWIWMSCRSVLAGSWICTGFSIVSLGNTAECDCLAIRKCAMSFCLETLILECSSAVKMLIWKALTNFPDKQNKNKSSENCCWYYYGTFDLYF